MAGLPWFEMDVDFPDEPRTVALNYALGPLAEAYVCRVWAYCFKLALDRVSGRAAVATIERAARWGGETGALVTALLEAGFLQREGEHLVVPDVRERLGPHLVKRERDRSRARDRRAEVAATIGRRRREVAGDRDKETDQEALPPTGARERARDEGEEAATGGTPSPGERVAGEDGSQASEARERSSPGPASEQSASPEELTGAEIPAAERPGAPVERRESGEGGPPAPPAAAKPRPAVLVERFPALYALVGALEAAGFQAEPPKDDRTKGLVDAIAKRDTVQACAERMLALVRADRELGVETRPWLGWHLETLEGQPKGSSVARTRNGAARPEDPERAARAARLEAAIAAAETTCVEWAAMLRAATRQDGLGREVIDRVLVPVSAARRGQVLELRGRDAGHAALLADRWTEWLVQGARAVSGEPLHVQVLGPQAQARPEPRDLA